MLTGSGTSHLAFSRIWLFSSTW